MILSEKFKFYFIHIPRTGGTSVEIALNDIHHTDTTTFQFVNHLTKEKHPQVLTTTYLKYRHVNQNFVKSILNNLQYDYKNWYEFTFVRNPYDRVLSLYEFYATRIWQNQSPKKFLSLDDFLTQLENLQNLGNFYKPQTYWIDSPLTAKVHLHRFENIQQEWQDICKTLSLDYKPLPHKNKSENRESVHLTDKQKETIYEYYKVDFLNLGYDK